MGDVAVADARRPPAGPSRGRGRRGGSRRSARRGCPAGCAPRRGAAGGRSCLGRSSVSSRVGGVGGRGAGRGGQGVDDRSAAPRRRGRRRGTTPRTRSAAGRRPGRAWRGRTPCRPSCPVREASAKSRTGRRGVGEEDAEHVAAAPAPRGVRRPGSAPRRRPTRWRRRRPVDVGVDLVGRQPQRGQPGGRRDRVPRQRAGLVDRPLRRRACAITSARPPNAAAGKPPPITLPKVTRSGRQPSTAPSRPHWP